ncbi:hypothetical protein ACLOJK_012667 [Asimina triloba]
MNGSDDLIIVSCGPFLKRSHIASCIATNSENQVHNKIHRRVLRSLFRAIPALERNPCLAAFTTFRSRSSENLLRSNTVEFRFSVLGISLPMIVHMRGFPQDFHEISRIWWILAVGIGRIRRTILCEMLLIIVGVDSQFFRWAPYQMRKLYSLVVQAAVIVITSSL